MKSHIISFLLLIIFLSSNSIIAQSNYLRLENETPDVFLQKLSNTTFYVDDDADPSWYNDTNFKTIMDAVNNSIDGDTIFVYNGTYYENVTITKSISLFGENKNTTIIDGRYIEEYSEFGSSIIRIFKADKIKVCGFTIQNVIKNNIAVDAGIRVADNSHGVIISNNIIKNIIDSGILLIGFNQVVSENIIMNTGTGIWCDASNSTITRNNITKLGDIGILLWGANNNKITQNNITYTKQAMVILESKMNLIKGNNFAYNTQSVFLSLSRRNKFYENNFIKCGYAGHVEFKGWSLFNRWRSNYWDNKIINFLPKILFGRFGVLPIPWFKFDWRPAKVPYKI